MNIEEVKQFIEWCKTNKVKSFKNTDISFELSELSYIDSFEEVKDIKEVKTTESEIEKDLDLFWSAR